MLFKNTTPIQFRDQLAYYTSMILHRQNKRPDLLSMILHRRNKRPDLLFSCIRLPNDSLAVVNSQDTSCAHQKNWSLYILPVSVLNALVAYSRQAFNSLHCYQECTSNYVLRNSKL
jgi:hypothetical protein